MISRCFSSNVRFFLRESRRFQHVRFVCSTSAASTSLTRKDDQLGTFTFVSDSSNDAEPLVVLVGFGGARDDVMAKYSNIYDKEGYARVRFCPEFPKLNSLVAYRPHARFLYDRLHEDCPHLESRNVIFHVCSMTGVRVFVAFWDLLHVKSSVSRIQKSKIRGLIFDSCPALILPQHVGLALARIISPLNQSRLRHYASFLLFSSVLWMHRAGILLFTLRNPKARSRHFSFARINELEDLPKHQLFLYTDKDDLCHPEYTRQFAAKQREAGAQVVEKCWAESEHCRHAVHYPDEYRSLCVEFARSVFK